jgi:uncharacterized membrane protein YeaQ/YmgE (transglycosylase-associated protein family)
MPTRVGSNLPDRQHDTPPSTEGTDVLRTATLIAGGAVGAILAITLLSAWRDTGAVATAAISAISAISGALIALFALEIRRRSKE